VLVDSDCEGEKREEKKQAPVMVHMEGEEGDSDGFEII
jgi:hypothetical protein